MINQSYGRRRKNRVEQRPRAHQRCQPRRRQKNPLLDQAISNLMKAKGVHCPRLTGAKYRMLLNLGITQQRKKL